MHKKLKHLIKNLKDVFDIDEINKIAKDFLSLNVFHGADICSSPLSQLASKYDALFSTPISKQALDILKFIEIKIDELEKLVS